MEDKVYKIETIQDILDCVTEENIDNFMIDLRSYLDIFINFQTMADIIGEMKGLSKEQSKIDAVFMWKDDGKHDHEIEISPRK